MHSLTFVFRDEAELLQQNSTAKIECERYFVSRISSGWSPERYGRAEKRNLLELSTVPLDEPDGHRAEQTIESRCAPHQGRPRET